MESYGLNAAINQADSLSSEGKQQNENIAAFNNKNVTDYLNNKKLLAREGVEDRTAEQASNLTKLAGYATGIKDKVDGYNDMIKEGGTAGIRGSKLLYKYPSAIKSAISRQSASVVSDAAPDDAEGAEDAAEEVAPEMTEPVYRPAGEFEMKTTGSVDVGDQTAGRIVGRKAATMKLMVSDGKGGLVPHDSPTATPIEDPAGIVTPAKPIENVSITQPKPIEPVEPLKPTTGSTALEGGAEEGAEDIAEKTGSTLGKTVGRVGGGIFAAASLGEDIHNQIKSKTFWAGDNTGDKIGNFLNEAGSVADIGGGVTADPFLVLAGVGLSAVGSAISEISELFGKDKKATPPPPPKPVVVQAATQMNLAGQGGVAETSKSTLKSVQMGSS